MAVDRNLRVRTGAGPAPTGVSVAIGWAGMLGAAGLAAALFSPAELPGRLLVVAVAAGVFAAVVADLRAVAAVTGLAMATFVGFLANRFGDLTGDADAWWYATLIGFASALGAGYRRMRPGRAASPSSPDQWAS